MIMEIIYKYQPPISFVFQVQDKSRYVGENNPISTIKLPRDTTVNMAPITDAVRAPSQPPPADYNTNLTTFKQPTSPTKPPSTKKTAAPGVARVPSEDSTYAYDNPALTPSPKSSIKGNGASF